MSKERNLVPVDLSDLLEGDGRPLEEQILSAALWKWEQEKEYSSYFSGGEPEIIPTITPVPLAFQTSLDWAYPDTEEKTVVVPLMDYADYDILHEITTVTLDRNQLKGYFLDVIGSSPTVWNKLRDVLPSTIMDNAVDARPMKKNDAGVWEAVHQYNNRADAWTKVGDDMFSTRFEVQYVRQISTSPRVSGYLVSIWSRWS